MNPYMAFVQEVLDHCERYVSDVDTKRGLDLLMRNVSVTPEMSAVSVGCNDDPFANAFGVLGASSHGYDLRPYNVTDYPVLRASAAYTHHLEDWLSTPLPVAFFDVAVSLSAVEHFGLSEFGGEQHDEGDRVAMELIYATLKPGGFALITVPFGAVWHSCPHWRRYREEDLQRRIIGRFQEVERAFWWTSVCVAQPEPTPEDLATYDSSADLSVGLLLRKPYVERR